MQVGVHQVAVGVDGLVVGAALDHRAVAVHAGGHVQLFAHAEGVDEFDAVVAAPVQVGAGVERHAAGQGLAHAGDQVVELAEIQAGRERTKPVALLHVGLETVDQFGEQEGVAAAQVEGVAPVHEGVERPGPGAVDAAAVAHLQGRVLVEGVPEVHAGVELEVVVLKHLGFGFQEVGGGVGLFGPQPGGEGQVVDLPAEGGVERVDVLGELEQVAAQRVGHEGAARELVEGGVDQEFLARRPPAGGHFVVSPALLVIKLRLHLRARLIGRCALANGFQQPPVGVHDALVVVFLLEFVVLAVLEAAGKLAALLGEGGHVGGFEFVVRLVARFGLEAKTGTVQCVQVVEKAGFAVVLVGAVLELVAAL